jgi:hypothetical protein
MKEPLMDAETLNRECSVFSIYLVGQPPSEYVKKKYRAAHQTGSLLGAPAHPGDDFLVRVARIGPRSAKLIDGYTRVFRPFSTVRKKLVLMLAILESCAPAHKYLDSADSAAFLVLLLRVVSHCLTFIVMVVIGLFLVFPAELIMRGKAKRIAS